MSRSSNDILGVYYDAARKRKTGEVCIGGMPLTLTETQRAALQSLMGFVQRAPASSVVPAYISAETGSGKTEVALRVAILLLREISSHLRQLHAIYLSPTRKLAQEISDRLNHMIHGEVPDVRMMSISGQDEDKVERVRDLFSVFRGEQKTFLATNVQFLSSLATKTASFYKLPIRAGQFQLAGSLSEANVIIVDEPHFYGGKACVRLLTLLLAILEHKRSSGGINPTLLLFMSATMNVPEIERLLRYLGADCGLGLVPLIDEAAWPLEERWIEIVEADHGEKWSVFEAWSDVPHVFERIGGIVNESKHFTVVYWDSVPMLARLQQFLSSRNHEAVVWHSQMPRRLQAANQRRLADDGVHAALVTSAAEVGVEFERWGVPTVDRMISVNTPSVAKAIQRWGRLARRNDAVGVMHFIDVGSRRVSISEQMGNAIATFDAYRRDYPSLLAKGGEFESEFSTAYRSLTADMVFAQTIRQAITQASGRVLPIYLPASIIVGDSTNDEQLSIPLGKLSAGAMVVQADAWLEFWVRNRNLFFTLQRGKLAWQPKALLLGSASPTQHLATIRSRALPQWSREFSIARAELWDGEVSLALPNVGAGFRFHSELLALHFPLGSLDVGPGFGLSEHCETLLGTFGPASGDLDAIAQRKGDENADIVFLYEPARRKQELSVGAVEYCWREILGGNYP